MCPKHGWTFFLVLRTWFLSRLVVGLLAILGCFVLPSWRFLVVKGNQQEATTHLELRYARVGNLRACAAWIVRTGKWTSPKRRSSETSPSWHKTFGLGPIKRCGSDIFAGNHPLVDFKDNPTGKPTVHCRVQPERRHTHLWFPFGYHKGAGHFEPGDHGKVMAQLGRTILQALFSRACTG